MSLDELESEALKLSPEARARLAEKLLASLDDLSDEENAKLWAAEAERRDSAWSVSDTGGRTEDVFRNARKKRSA